MAKTDLNTLKKWFKTGLKPTQTHFWNWLDSFRHKDDAVPVSDVDGLDNALSAKANNSELATVAKTGDYEDLENKPDTSQIENLGETGDSRYLEEKEKGVANGLVPLNSVGKTPYQFLDIINNLTTGGATKLASAETVKTLKGLIDGINTVLNSTDINLDTLQEIVDAIKDIDTYLDTILVNDLTTGGTTKALTAEQGKVLKSLADLKLNTADLLTAIKAVDGKGSGLDADLFQGQEKEEFSRKVLKTTSSGGATNVNKWTKILEVELTQTFAAYTASLSFISSTTINTPYKNSIELKVRQDSSFGNDPVVTITPSRSSDSEFLKFGYKVSRNTPDIMVEIYVSATSSNYYTTYGYLNMDRVGSGSEATYLSDQPYNTTVSGLVEVDSYKDITTKDTEALHLGDYTVSELPNPSETAYATVTDALNPDWNTTLTGGGSVTCPVFYDGSVWRAVVSGIIKIETSSATSFTLAPSHAYKVTRLTAATSININTGSLTNIGDTAILDTILNTTVPFVGGAGVTIEVNGNYAKATYGSISRITIQLVDTNTYRIYGDLHPIAEAQS